MNTVFKLGYQAWLLLGLAGVGALALARASGCRGARLRWTLAWPLAALLVGRRVVYPVAGTYARKGGFDRAPTLDGLGWLRDRAPGDLGAIDWLNDNAAGGAVVLESVGEDYSAFGHARISTFTGLPDRAGLAGPRAASGATTSGTRREDVERDVRVADDGAARRSCSTATASATSSSARSSAPTYGDAGDRASGTQLGRRVFDARRDDGRVRLDPPARLGSGALAHVEPLRQAARRVPRLALA